MFRAYLDFWRRTFDFKGSTSFKEFWLFVLADIILTFLFGYIMNSLTIELPTDKINFYGLGIYEILKIIPTFSLLVRRCHDVRRSGWTLLWLFVPVVGWLVILAIIFQRSQEDRDREFDRKHW